MLIVEDDIGVAGRLKRLMDKRIPGVVIEMASSLKVGIEQFREHQPSIVVLDADLGDSDAFSTMKAIDEEFTGSAVVVYSGYWEEALHVFAFEHGAEDFVLKGSESDIVERVINAHHRLQYASRQRTPK